MANNSPCQHFNIQDWILTFWGTTQPGHPGKLLALMGITTARVSRFAHPEGQNEDKNEERLRKSKEKMMEIWGKMRKVQFLPTRNCEASNAFDRSLTQVIRYWFQIIAHQLPWLRVYLKE